MEKYDVIVIGAGPGGSTAINIATAVRQPYEAGRRKSVEATQQAVYEAAYRMLTEELDLRDSAIGIPSP